MLYFFYGSDAGKARARARGVIAAMKKKRPDAEYFRITADLWAPASFEELVGGQGLFDRKCIVFADGIFENKEAKEWTLEQVSRLASSENAFVYLEEKLDAASLKKIEKVAEEVKSFVAPELLRSARREFNVFSLADALGKRKSLHLWSLLLEAFLNDVSPEEVCGVLFWQVKAMLLATLEKSASAAGLKPFVYEKSRRYALLYRKEELLDLSRKLVSIYHDAHRGIHDFPTALERFALTL